MVAENYVRNLKTEIRKGQLGQLKIGLLPWAAPVGYQNNGAAKLKTPDPAAAPLVQRAFELYGSGTHSMRTLMVEMKRRGLRSHSGRPLYKSGIEQMLGNPFYCGIIRVQRSGETFKGAHEPIITTAIFDRVQDIKSGKKVKKFTRHNHLYRGLFRCQHCDRSLVGELHKGRVYYRCQTAQCDTQSVREDRVSEAVSAILAQLSMTTDDLAIALKRLPAQLKQENHGNELAAIELQREQVAARIERLTDMMLDGLIDGHAFQAKKQALLIEQRRVDEQLALTALNTVSEARVHRFLELATNLAQLYDSAAKPEKRRIVEWATLNRTATGKSVCFEPSKWLTGTKTMLAALSCADVRDDSRTDDLDLANLVRSAEKAMRSDPQLAD